MLYQQLVEREKQFSEEHQDGEKNRATLLKVLMELAPKPKQGKKFSTLYIVREAMQRLAGDWLWQYICATGRSGTKVSMRSKMPNIMDTVILTACKTLEVDPKEASSALSVYLKNTGTRASAKMHREKLLVGGHQKVHLDNSAKNGGPQHAITCSEERQGSKQLNSGGEVSDDDTEESQSLLRHIEEMSEISDGSDTE